MAQKISELKGLQKRAKEDKERRQREEEKHNDAKGIDVGAIKDWITQSTDQLLKQQELSEYLKTQIAQREQLEDEMLEEGDRLTELSIEKERLEMELNIIEENESKGIEFDEARKLEIE